MNETPLTVTGNLVDDPELRFTPVLLHPVSSRFLKGAPPGTEVVVAGDPAIWALWVGEPVDGLHGRARADVVVRDLDAIYAPQVRPGMSVRNINNERGPQPLGRPGGGSARGRLRSGCRRGQGSSPSPPAGGQKRLAAW